MEAREPCLSSLAAFEWIETARIPKAMVADLRSALLAACLRAPSGKDVGDMEARASNGRVSSVTRVAALHIRGSPCYVCHILLASRRSRMGSLEATPMAADRLCDVWARRVCRLAGAYSGRSLRSSDPDEEAKRAGLARLDFL